MGKVVSTTRRHGRAVFQYTGGEARMPRLREEMKGRNLKRTRTMTIMKSKTKARIKMRRIEVNHPPKNKRH